MNCSVKTIITIALLILLAPSWASAAPPKITRLSVRGLQTGSTTRVAITGSDLLPEPRLLADLPIVSQQVQGTPRANAIEIEVTLDQSVTPGVYNLRLSTPEGITSPEIIAVDHLPQSIIPVASAASTVLEQLPIALHGTIAGSAVQEIKFRGHQNEPLTLDVMARRLGSKLRPVVHLYDSQRRQLAWSLPNLTLAGDCRVSVTLPADDTYTAVVHDLTYASAVPGHFRLAIGTFDYVDQVFPAVVSRSGSTPLELLGKLGDKPLAKLDATAAAASLKGDAQAALTDWRPVAWPVGAKAIGLRPRVQLSDLTELVEGHTLDASRLLAKLPVAVNGVLTAPGEEDVYHVEVVEGDKLRCEVFADRIGSPLDATVELRNVQGARLVQNDDSVGPDPRVDYTVVKGVTRVTIAVADAYRRGDTSYTYRLVATKVEPTMTTLTAGSADFRLTVFDDTHHIAVDGSKVLRVEAERLNYEGPIRLMVDGLPAGFSAMPVEIPAGVNSALVELRRGAMAKDATPGRIVIRGQSVDTKPIVSRAAALATYPLGDLQPWLRYDVAVAPTTVSQRLGVAWNESAADGALYLGVDGKLTLRFERGPGAIGPIRLSLLTSQIPPLANGQPSLIQTIRGTTPTIDIPLDNAVKSAFDALTVVEKAVVDLEKKQPAKGDAEPALVEQIKQATAKRDEAAQKLREAEAKLKPTYEYALLVPADLKTVGYDLSIRAELRSLDNQTTLAEAYTVPRRLTIQAPLELAATKVDKPFALDPKTGATIKLAGTLKRLGGFAGDVTLTLIGLPTGIVPPRVVLKPKEEPYLLEFKLPPTFAAEQIENVQLSATLVPDARRANITAKVDLPLAVIRLEKATPVAD